MTLNSLAKTPLLCKKTFKFLYKGKYYNVVGGRGDPEGAIEAGYSDDMPLEFVSVIIISTNRGNKSLRPPSAYSLKVNDKYPNVSHYAYLWDVFYKPQEVRKLKLKKIQKNTP